MTTSPNPMNIMLKTEAEISDKYKQYEEAKKELKKKNLTPKEYEAEIKKLAKKLNI